MKRTAALLIAGIVLCLSPALLAGDNLPFDRAERAMKLRDYPAAITICLGLLETAPGNYDVNFLLAQAYSRSGERDKAMAQLVKMDALFPMNSDVILFMARIHTWKGEYAKAQARYEEVLAFAPANEEAQVGTADIAARQRDYARAHAILWQVLEKDPRNAAAYYHLGLLYQWQGNRGRARESFENAVALDPANDDYRAFLTRATPRMQPRFELRYGHEVETWNDGREDFQNDRLALHLELPRSSGVLILKYNQTLRFGDRDHQFGLEAYPKLWTKAYGRFELDYASPAVSYPEWSYLAEIYQGFFSAAEVSAGVWHMTFPDRPVTVLLGSLGYYWGNTYPYVRFNVSDDSGHRSFSWVLNVRRYFSSENFVYAGFGKGSLLTERPAIDDLWAGRGTVWLAGVTWYVFQKIRMEGHFSSTTESGLARTSFILSAGYRWK